jgi:D-alanyl-D-alanine endopeptidase (penicillin-binding protein 7)
MIANQPVVIVLLDSWGKLTRLGDAARIKRWLEKSAVVAATPLKRG